MKIVILLICDSTKAKNIRQILKQREKGLPILVAVYLYLTASLVINKSVGMSLHKVSLDLFYYMVIDMFSYIALFFTETY